MNTIKKVAGGGLTRSVFSIFVVAAILMSGFFVVNSVQAADTWDVWDVNVAYPNNDNCAALKQCNTIQAAIDAATSGDTINVAAGMYAESVTVDKTLSIIGAGPSTIIQPPIDQDGIVIIADDVLIKDLEVSTSNSGVNPNIAISIQGTIDVEINNNVIETTGDKAMGIWVGGSSNSLNPSINLKIVKNSITIGGIATGIYAAHSNPAHTGWIIGGSAIDANSITMASANPLELYDVTNSEVSYNILTITSAVDASNVIWSSELSDINNLLFKNNTVSGSSGSEVAIVSDFIGVTPVTSVSTVTVSGNTFSNWGSRGLKIGSGVTSVTASGNKFLGTGEALKNEDVAQVNAETNWWGSPTGPADGAVVGDVDFDPWCTDDTCSTFSGGASVASADPAIVDSSFIPGIGSSLTRGNTAYIGRTTTYTGSALGTGDPETIFWRVTVHGPSALTADMVNLDEMGWTDTHTFSLGVSVYPFEENGGDLVTTGSCDAGVSAPCSPGTGFSLDVNDIFTNADKIKFNSNAPTGAYTIKYELVNTAGGSVVGTHEIPVEIILADQTITFDFLIDKTYGDAPFNVSATASSGLDVSFSIVSGPATILGNTITITGAGPVVVRASQAGGGNYGAAPNVDRSFTVNKANATITVNGYTGTYDSFVHGASGTATGVNGEDLSTGLDFGDSFTDVPGGTASWTFTDANYNDTGDDVAIDITPKALTVTAVANTKVYDSDITAVAVPTITSGTLATGDTTTNFAETYDNANVGTGKILTASGIVNDGNGGANYNYTFVTNTNGIILAATQTTPDNETGNATVDSTTPQVVITNPDQAVTVTVSGTTAATIDVSSFITGRTGTLPAITINSNVANVTIPATTLVTGPDTWNGIIQAPVAGIPTGSAPAGFSVGDTVISIGSPDGTLTFDKTVKVTLMGVTGTVGYKPALSNDWVTITTQCTGADDSSNISSGECYFTDGGNTIIWTYHFTEFGELDPIPPTPTPSSRGSSRAGDSIRTSTPVTGQVLGAFTEAERQAQIATIRASLISLINQLIGLLQAQLAAAIQAQGN